MAQLREVISWIDARLEVSKARDVAFNGLQVEGRTELRKIVTGVSANLALLQAAKTKAADLVIAHHGLVWGGIQTIRGPLRQRLALLLGEQMSLAAYHLPLDMHPELGNNAGLSRLFDLQNRQAFGDYKGQQIGFMGELSTPMSLADFAQKVRSEIHPNPLVLDGGGRKITRVALCSGGAAELLDEAIDKGCDLFLTGESTEYWPALVQESGVHAIAAGHHATERFGVRQLGEALAQQFACEIEFVDVENPL